MKTTMAIWCGIALALFTQPLCQASDLLVCPSVLDVEQTITSTHSGWSLLGTNGRHRFIGVEFSEGPPDQKAILAPSTESYEQSKMISIWIFPPSNQGYWVSCMYSNTSAVVTQRLEDGISLCEVEYDGRFSAPVVKQWRCK